MFKAVIMDGDGSTITHDWQMPANLQELIQARANIKWIMATGRSYDLLRKLPIIDYLSRDVPHILDGGSRLMTQAGKSVLDFYLSTAEINQLFAVLDVEAVEFIYYYLDADRSFLYSSDRERYSNLSLVRSATTTTQISTYHSWCLHYPPTKIFIKVKRDIQLPGLNWHQNEQNIDITAHGIDKGSSCCLLFDRLGLHPHEAIFVFNDKNDLPLVTHPDLIDLTTIKVGNYLPTTPASYAVADPFAVAPLLARLL